MPRDVQDPTINQRGDESHPAFGLISATRVTSTFGAVLFDSDIRHGSTVIIRLKTATRKRELYRDWLYGDRELFELELSEAQWASFVSSFSQGDGVPCTIRSTPGEHGIPGLPFAPRMKESMDELRESANRMFADIKVALQKVVDSQSDGVKVRRAALNNLVSTVSNAAPNITFAGESLVEYSENVVQRARADIEAMVTQRAQQLGLTGEQSKDLLELEQ